MAVPSACAPVGSNRLKTPASECPKTLAKARAAILAAEQIPLNSTQSAFRRYAQLDDVLHSAESDLGALGDLPVSPGHLGDRNSVEIFASIQALCGQSVADRIVVFDAWIRVLMAQASDAVVKPDPRCRAWLRVTVHHDILVSAATVSQMLSRYGPRDRDVGHMAVLVATWAKQENVVLPPLTESAAIETQLQALGPAYEKANNASSAAC